QVVSLSAGAAHEASRRLATTPGIGSITASAIVATVANATEFNQHAISLPFSV
ncbi:MAG: transposase, partial [Alphaproteobacteria bacterium]|nr:transposase [Alphaproteobacteria bacterium]